MGTCQSRQSILPVTLHGCCRSNAVVSRPSNANEPSPHKSASPLYATPIHTPKSKRNKTPPEERQGIFATPSESTVAETEASNSPEGTLASLYLASPLATVIFEEEENPDQPSDEEDSVYQTNDVPLDEATGALRKFRTSTIPRPVHIEELPPPNPKTKQSVNQDAMSHFKQLKLQAKLLKKAKHKQQKHKKYEERIEDVQSYKQLWKDFQDIEDEVSSIDGHQPPHLPPSPHSKEYHGITEMYFDFQNFDFGDWDDPNLNDNDDASQVSQSNLSLLSEQSMEAQRRYYAEKKRKKKKAKKKAHSGTSSQVSVDGSVSSMGSRDYGPVRRNMRRPPLHIEETVLADMEVMIPDLEDRLKLDCDNDSYVSDLGDDCTLGSNSSSLHDYGVPRRRHRHRTTPSNPTRPPKSSFQSKLDSLESAVADLQGNHDAATILTKSSVEAEIPTEACPRETLVIVDTFVPPSGEVPPPDEQKNTERKVSSVSTTKTRMTFEPQVDDSSYASSPEQLLEAAQQTLSKRGGSVNVGSSYGSTEESPLSANFIGSLSEVSPIKGLKREDQVHGEIPLDANELAVASPTDVHDEQVKSRAKDPPGRDPVGDSMELPHGLLNTSCATDESSVNSDFGDLRSRKNELRRNANCEPMDPNMDGSLEESHALLVAEDRILPQFVPLSSMATFEMLSATARKENPEGSLSPLLTMAP